MNIFSEKSKGTGPKAHIVVGTIASLGKNPYYPQTFARLVNPDGKDLVIDEGKPIEKLAQAIASRKSTTIFHVGFNIIVETKGNKVMIGWGIKDRKIDLFAYDAEKLLEQIGPELVNQYLGLVIIVQ